ncbi:hypothetical protein [Bacillus marinisedimentorum]|uniref:UPF0738 family protein n=1 Tax=Bacillus marinisedimentorum TaxID=1821260 RepID=UPI0008733C67|nr:hypothetical protein [Bacillus marinisedimentorum]
MRTRIEVKEALFENDRLVLQPEIKHNLEGLAPGRRVLADSDQLSFIYILEDQEEFVYISLPKHIWPMLKEAFGRKAPVILTSDENELELSDFHVELAELVENISGNANYGEEMEQEVTEIFGN